MNTGLNAHHFLMSLLKLEGTYVQRSTLSIQYPSKITKYGNFLYISPHFGANPCGYSYILQRIQVCCRTIYTSGPRPGNKDTLIPIQIDRALQFFKSSGPLSCHWTNYVSILQASLVSWEQVEELSSNFLFYKIISEYIEIQHQKHTFKARTLCFPSTAFPQYQPNYPSLYGSVLLIKVTAQSRLI